MNQMLSYACIAVGSCLILWSLARMLRNAAQAMQGTPRFFGAKHAKKQTDEHDESQYPYEMRLIIDGITSKAAGNRIRSSLDSLSGVWATVDLDANEAHVHMRSELPISVLSEAVTRGGGLLLNGRLTKSPDK